MQKVYVLTELDYSLETNVLGVFHRRKQQHKQERNTWKKSHTNMVCI